MFDKITKKIFQAATSSETQSLQKATSAALQAGIKDLEKFTQTEMVDAIASQKNAFTGLEQLSKNVRSMLK